MPANTAHNYPYPLGTDRVMDGDDSIKALAQAVDTQLGLAACGSVSVPIVTAGVPASVTVTLPAGRFTNTPNVVTACQGSATNVTSSSVAGISKTSIDVWASRSTGTTAITVHWIAHQFI